MLIDACLTVAAFLGAYGLRTALVGQPALLVHLALLPIIVPTWAFLLVFFRAYRSPGEASVLDLSLATMRAAGGGLVLLVVSAPESAHAPKTRAVSVEAATAEPTF